MSENQTNHNSPKRNSINSASEQHGHDADSLTNSLPSVASTLRNRFFWATLFSFAGVYLLLIVAMLIADLQFNELNRFN